MDHLVQVWILIVIAMFIVIEALRNSIAHEVRVREQFLKALWEESGGSFVLENLAIEATVKEVGDDNPLPLHRVLHHIRRLKREGVT